MTTVIQHKRSLTGGTRPAAGGIADGEAFINTSDGVMVWKDAGGTNRVYWLTNLQLAPRTVSASTSTTFTLDGWLIFSAACTLTLPTPSTSQGRILNVKNTAAVAVISASSNVVPLAGGSAGTAILAATVGKWATLVCDGTNWVVMQAN